MSEAGADPAELRNYHDAAETLAEDLDGKVSDLRTDVSALDGYAGDFTMDVSNIQTVDLADSYYVTNLETLVSDIKTTDKIALDTAERFRPVASGDNLWVIAEQALVDSGNANPTDQEIADYVDEIVENNELQSGNPDLIYVNEELYLPPVPGADDSPEDEDLVESSDDDLEEDPDSSDGPETDGDVTPASDSTPADDLSPGNYSTPPDEGGATDEDLLDAGVPSNYVNYDQDTGYPEQPGIPQNWAEVRAYVDQLPQEEVHSFNDELRGDVSAQGFFGYLTDEERYYYYVKNILGGDPSNYPNATKPDREKNFDELDLEGYGY